MSETIDLDISAMVDALDYVEVVTGRTAVESLNRAALTVLIGSGTGPGAARLTPKALRGAILAVTDAQIRAFLVKKLKANGEWPKTNSELTDLIDKERKRRLRAIGYAAFAGWNNAVKNLGGQGFGSNITKDFNKSEASHGFATKASILSMIAEMVNTAPAAEKIGWEALQQGIDNAAKDLEEYGHKKMQENFNRVGVR